jgi:hypothetical protein
MIPARVWVHEASIGEQLELVDRLAERAVVDGFTARPNSGAEVANESARGAQAGEHGEAWRSRSREVGASARPASSGLRALSCEPATSARALKRAPSGMLARLAGGRGSGVEQREGSLDGVSATPAGEKAPPGGLSSKRAGGCRAGGFDGEEERSLDGGGCLRDLGAARRSVAAEPPGRAFGSGEQVRWR